MYFGEKTQILPRFLGRKDLPRIDLSSSAQLTTGHLQNPRRRRRFPFIRLSLDEISFPENCL